MTIYAPIISTEYSGGESYGKIKDYVKIVADRAKETGEDAAIILADKFSTAAQIPFYQECLKNNVKPVFGLRVTVQDEVGDYDLILVAQDEAGRQNLNRITTIAYQETVEKNYSRVLLSDIIQNKEGVACISPASNGIIANLIKEDKSNDALEKAQELKSHFPDNLYLSVTRNGANDEEMALQEKIIQGTLDISNKLEIDIIADNNIKYPRKSDYELHLIRKNILNKELSYDPSVKITENPNQYVMPTSQMIEIYGDMKEAIFNSAKLVSETSQEEFKNRLNVSRLPEFPIPDGFDNSEVKYLRHLTDLGFKNRWENDIKPYYLEKIQNENIPNAEEYIQERYKEYEDRVAFEIDVIENTGFAGYFLIVQDLTNWCKREDIPVGPGRGSGAGSLVLYSLNITDVNPIPYDLLFERFLNPERLSEPDIDIDFSPKNRERVITYMKGLYGEENTAQILTEGTLAAKSSIDSVGRISGMKPADTEAIKSLLTDTLGYSIKDEMEYSQSLMEAYGESNTVKNIIDKAMEIEGSINSYGKHAGGVVISLGDMSQYAALYRAKDEAHSPVVQIDKDLCERIGLIKFDILGLKNLDVIYETLRSINDGVAEENKLKAEDIRTDDKKAISLFQNADTYGIFQFESGGMRRIMKELRPDNFEEVVALVALYRPGPLQSGMHESFIERKFDPSKLKYIHQDLVDQLEPTKGTIIYQEQVMSIARKLAGYTLGKADILRKAMGKKDMQTMFEQNQMFIDGCLDNYREKTIKTTSKKLPNPNNKEQKLAVDVVMENSKLEYLKELTKEDGFKIVKSEQLYDVLRKYAGFDDDEMKTFKAEYKEMEEGFFYKKVAPRFMKFGVEKAMQDGLSIEDAKEEMAALSVRTSMFIRFNKIFNVMEKFAAYGFNKSHSVAYAKVSMQTAYLKAHYPSQYMAAMLSNESSLDAVTRTLAESKRMGLKILQPDINESGLDFKPISNRKEEKEIRYGLSQIKGINKVVEHLVRLRGEMGKFEDIYDLYNKLGGYKIIEKTELLDGSIKESSKTLLTKSVLTNLINSGALDSLAPNNDPNYRTHLYATFNLLETAEKNLRKNLRANVTEINKKMKAVMGDSTTEANKKIKELTGINKLADVLNPSSLGDYNVEEAKGVYEKINAFIQENQPPKKKVALNIKEITSFPDALIEAAGKDGYEKIGDMIYAKPDTTAYKAIPEYNTPEAAMQEKVMTGAFMTINPINLNGIRGKIHKKGLTVTNSKDLATSVSMMGNPSRNDNRKYLDVCVVGTVIDVGVFQQFDSETGESFNSILVKLDDGDEVINVTFRDNKIFNAGREKRGATLLESMKDKDVLIVEGSAQSQDYDSADLRVFARNIGSANEEIYLPTEKPYLNITTNDIKKTRKVERYNKPSANPTNEIKQKQDFRPITDAQKRVMEIMISKGALNSEEVFKESNVEKVEELSIEQASAYISKINEERKRKQGLKV